MEHYSYLKGFFHKIENIRYIEYDNKLDYLEKYHDMISYLKYYQEKINNNMFKLSLNNIYLDETTELSFKINQIQKDIHIEKQRIFNIILNDATYINYHNLERELSMDIFCHKGKLHSTTKPSIIQKQLGKIDKYYYLDDKRYSYDEWKLARIPYLRKEKINKITNVSY